MSDGVDVVIIAASAFAIYYYVKTQWKTPPPAPGGPPKGPTNTGSSWTPTAVMRMEDELESWLQSVDHWKLASEGIGLNDPPYAAAAENFYKKNGWDPNDFTNWMKDPEANQRVAMWTPNAYWGPAPGTSKPSN